MGYKGISVDIDFCTGCEACVLACQQECGYDEKKFGIKISKLGPMNIEGKKWQYDFIPQFTDWCDLCAARTEKGKLPTCVQHCQAQCLEYGDVEELAKNVSRQKQIIVAIKKD